MNSGRYCNVLLATGATTWFILSNQREVSTLFWGVIRKWSRQSLNSTAVITPAFRSLHFSLPLLYGLPICTRINHSL